jgi:hypothetical protein
MGTDGRIVLPQGDSGSIVLPENLSVFIANRAVLATKQSQTLHNAESTAFWGWEHSILEQNMFFFQSAICEFGPMEA